MSFQRREGLAGGGITKYADKNLKCCPFCGSEEPHWLTDAYIAKYSLIGAKCVNGYKFKCEKCGGVLEIQAHTDFNFQNETFVSVKLLESGQGTRNSDKLNENITIQQLKLMCEDNSKENSESIEKNDEIRIEQQPKVEANESTEIIDKKNNSEINDNSNKAKDIFGKIGFILGFVSLGLSITFFLSAVVFGIAGPAGIVLSALGKKGNNTQKARVGFVCSLIGTIISVIVFYVILIVIYINN